jgi:hypothetical protein
MAGKRDEVEEFLRRAAARRAQAEAQRRAKSGQQAGSQPPYAPQQPQRTAPARLAQSLGTEDIVLLEPIDAEIIEAEVVRSPNRISASVDRNMDGSRQIGRKAMQFSQQVDQADENMEAHLHQVFDHKLGHLRKDNIAGGPAPPVASANDTRVSEAASSIAAMLRSPASLRAAIILNEIMTPPRHLW